jgi:hypothetical protein
MFEAITLCDRYYLAKEMVQKTKLYYQQLSSTIPQNTMKRWEDKITWAESNRSVDISLMDVMGARQLGNTAESGPDPILTHNEQSKWLGLALSIEEQQWVFCLGIIHFV